MAEVLISADSHVHEPPGLWVERLPVRFSDQAPRRVPTGPMNDFYVFVDGAMTLVLRTEHVGEARDREDAALASGTYDLATRLAVQDEEGIAAEVLYPTMGQMVWSITDSALLLACARVYNDWLVETFGSRPDRFVTPAMIPVLDVADGVAEIERCARNGMRAASLPMNPPAGRPYSDPAYEPIWAALAANRMPVGLHVGTGYPPAGVALFDPENITLLGLLTGSEEFNARANIAHLLASGVFERHPELQVVMVETGIGWMGRMFDRFDTAVSGKSNVTHRFVSPLPELPSFYLRRQVHATFMDDEVGILNRAVTGVEPLLWSADFPHVEGLYPECQTAVARLTVDCSESERAAIVRDNAARLYGLEVVA